MVHESENERSDGCSSAASRGASCSGHGRAEAGLVDRRISRVRGVVLFILAGSSQSVRAAWLETQHHHSSALHRLDARQPAKASRWFPYGHHRWTSIAFLGAATALLGLSVYLLYDAGATLLSSNQPASIGSIRIFGISIWSGCPIFAALVWPGVPAWSIGKATGQHGREDGQPQAAARARAS